MKVGLLALLLCLVPLSAAADNSQLVRQTVRSRMDQVRYCIWEEVARSGNVPGTLTLRIHVSADGSLDVAPDEEVGDGLKFCLGSALNGVKVSGWAGPAQAIRFPLTLKLPGPGKLAPTLVKKRLNGLQGSLKRCAGKSPGFEVSGILVIDSKGFVRAVWQKVKPHKAPKPRQRLAFRAVDRCLVHRLRGLRFPKPSPSGYLRVAYGYDFKRSEPKVPKTKTPKKK